VTAADYNTRLDGLKDSYDLIIIGGGIYGAAMLWEAVSRGLSTVLLEKDDFGSGTSANSLKIIHGGIRYLQDLDFRRMRKSIQERRALSRIAPHLIRPLECVIPTYRKIHRHKLALWGAFKLYDCIACDRNDGLGASHRINAGKIISADEFRKILPSFEDGVITGAAQWHDAQAINTERLVLAFVMSAVKRGGHACNHLKAKEYHLKNNHIQGVIAYDELTSAEFLIHAKTVIDCTGPSAMQRGLKENIGLAAGSGLVRAVNIVVRHHIADCAVGIRPAQSEDDRLLFITPWRNGSIIGTWYFSQESPAETLVITKQEIAHCIAQINGILPSLNLSHDDITLVHLGWLPLGFDGASKTLQNKFEVFKAAQMNGPEGLFWVQGVKFTTARHVAAHTIDVVSKQINKPVQLSVSDATPLYGGEIEDFDVWSGDCQRRYKGRFTAGTIDRLLHNYGTNIDTIADYLNKDISYGEPVPGVPEAIKAEISFILDHEMTYTLSDLLLRRTDLGTFECPRDETIGYCADEMAARWCWDQDTKKTNIKAVLGRYPEWGNSNSLISL